MAEFLYKIAALPENVSDARQLLSRAAVFFSEKSQPYFEAITQKKNDKAFIHSASGVALLGKMLSELKLPQKKLTLRRLENGRPYIENASLDFNISHTDNAVMCAVTECGIIGCDIQSDRYYSEEKLSSLAGFFMTDEQLAEFAVSNDKNAYFYRLWTVKEACLKCVGGNLKTADNTKDTTVHTFVENGCYSAVCFRKAVI